MKTSSNESNICPPRRPASRLRRPARTPLALLALCIALFAQGAAAQKSDKEKSGASDAEKAAQFPAKLVDIEGRAIDVTKLAHENNLVVVTLKATWCPVCRRQLERIRDMLPKLEPCKVTFIVLSPGPADDLAKIKKSVGFPFPFVADDNLTVARSLGLDRPGKQIFPCMFQVLKNRHIGWKQLGRNGAYFGDGALERYFDCRPV